MMEKEETNLTISEKKEKKKYSKKVIISCVLIIILLFCLPLYLFSISDRYYIFDEERTKKMENTFGMSFDGVKLKEYDILGHYGYKLKFSGVEDYHIFMENNLNGKIVSMEEDGILYDYRNNTNEDCQKKDYDACYVYISDKKEKELTVYFYKKNNGTYSAEIIITTL